ncbi:MAG TPA: hypothetical protein VMU60_03855 [Syntrophobacteria bacterium]|nr:hypothetical protein [Syntrophobacteria bacterium]
MNTSIPAELVTLISQHSLRPAPPGVRPLCDEIHARYGSAVQAVLFYGSCLRRNDETEGIVDLYVLVDSYRRAYRKGTLAAANRLLPPNVFYLELPWAEGLVRAKYAVLSMPDFSRGTSRRWFHSYLWGRFAQPSALVYARDTQVAAQVYQALAQAVVTFISRVIPRLPVRFTAREVWQEGLALSYRTELRAERSDKVVHLFETWQDYYEQATRAAMPALPFPVELAPETQPLLYHAAIPTLARSLSRLTWILRSLQGKVLSVLRLCKGLFTFQGGLEYVLWKIERHSGIRVERNPRQGRYSLLEVARVLWRLYRSGAYR